MKIHMLELLEQQYLTFYMSRGTYVVWTAPLLNFFTS